MYQKVEVFIPESHYMQLADALNEAGLLAEGNYDYSFSITEVIGHWRPLEGASPFDGQIGVLSSEREMKMEFRILASEVEIAKTIIYNIHPYEVPVVNFIPLI